MADSEKQPPPSFAAMPCPAFLYVAEQEGKRWKVVAYKVLFAQHDGESARMYLCHPAFGGLVTVDEVAARYPAILMIDPTEEEASNAMLLVRAKAVARSLPRDPRFGPDRTGGRGDSESRGF